MCWNRFFFVLRGITTLETKTYGGLSFPSLRPPFCPFFRIFVLFNHPTDLNQIETDGSHESNDTAVLFSSRNTPSSPGYKHHPFNCSRLMSSIPAFVFPLFCLSNFFLVKMLSAVAKWEEGQKVICAGSQSKMHRAWPDLQR